MKTVVLDFDGVIHSYASGWQGIDVIPDPPVAGIRKAIDDLRKVYRVVVVSSRCAEERGTAAITEYLTLYGIRVDGICAEKPPAVCYVDDRAIRFDGDPEKMLREVKAFRSWTEREVKTMYSFGQAIEMMKNGARMSRAGWNGKRQYIELASCISYRNARGETVNAEHAAIGNAAVAFVGTSGVQLGWLASQADMLAEDWVEFDGE